MTRETGFDIAVASEVMAVLALATDLTDLRARCVGRVAAAPTVAPYLARSAACAQHRHPAGVHPTARNTPHPAANTCTPGSAAWWWRRTGRDDL
jgi:hypothetical protein